MFVRSKNKRHALPYLGVRYRDDRVPLLKLNPVQEAARQAVLAKIASDTYRFEMVTCVVCGGSEWTLLAEKDRYGLPLRVVVCRRCGLVQTNPRMDSQSYESFYASEYRPLYGGDDGPTEAFYQRQVQHGQRILDYLERKAGLTRCWTNRQVYEVGCGAGGILEPFRAAGAIVEGIDLGPEYVRFGVTKHGLDLRVGTLAQCPPRGKPDLVIYSHVLEHLSDPCAELNLLRHHLHEETKVYIEVPGLRYILWSYEGDILRYLQNAHLYHFSLCTLRAVLAKAGFKLIVGDEVIRRSAQLVPGTRCRTCRASTRGYLRTFVLWSWEKLFFPSASLGSVISWENFSAHLCCCGSVPNDSRLLCQ